MKLTITVSNWNRDWHLDRSIYLLSKQTLPQNDWELIVVDDGSTDKTNEVLAKYKNQNIIKNLHYIKKVNKRINYGNCAIARNIGAKFGTGDYILFTDPEVMPLSDWAEQHLLAHEGKLDRNFVGYCLQPREYHVVNNSVICRGAFLGDSYKDYDWFNINETWKKMEDKINNVKIKYNLTDKEIRDEFYIYQATQAGHSISRELFNKLRGFEESFANASIGLDKWAGEDTWFHICLSRIKSPRIELNKARAIHIYHNKVCSNYDAVTYAHVYAKEHPDQWQSNVGKEWGLIEENGFKVIF